IGLVSLVSARSSLPSQDPTGMGAAGSTFRQCDIDIKNESATYILANPRMYTDHGSCITPFQPTVAPGATGSALFRKTPNTATGSVGVVTYDLLNKDTNLTAEKIAMYYDEPTTFSRQDADGSWLTYKGGNITIKGTMSNSYQPVIKERVGLQVPPSATGPFQAIR
ncbi:hypothetical protein KUCAC02_031832, partial [Chaenocephalus aceratus]